MRLVYPAVIAVVALAWAGDAQADTSPASSPAADAPKSTKARRLAEKAAATTDRAAKRAWQQTLNRRIGKKPTPVVNIYNTWTREFVVVDRSATSTLPKPTVDRFLRCHFTNEPTDMAPALFPALVAAAHHFRANRINIVSGFRAPKYNLVLRKKGRGVARRSQHPQGNAVDFRIPGVSTQRLRSWVLSRKLGGVGYYPSSGFIHMDTGRRRTWTGR